MTAFGEIWLDADRGRERKRRSDQACRNVLPPSPGGPSCAIARTDRDLAAGKSDDSRRITDGATQSK